MLRVRFLALAIVVLAVLCAAGLAQSAPEDGQVIKVGLYVLNLGKLDISTGAFSADFYLSMKSDKPIADNSFEFMNGRAASMELLEDNKAEGKYEKFYRVLANLNTHIDLKRFPFDSQVINIIIENKTEPISKVRYEPMAQESGLDPAVDFAGWQILGWGFQTKEHYYPVYDETYSQLVYKLDIGRLVFSSFLKTFLPVMFLILIVVSSFILNPEQVATRLAAISSALVASVMFHVSISNQIPPVGYLTFADKYMILTYLILLCCFFLNIYVFILQNRKDVDRAKRINKLMERLVFLITPALYAAFFIFLK